MRIRTDGKTESIDLYIPGFHPIKILRVYRAVRRLSQLTHEQRVEALSKMGFTITREEA